MPSDDESPPFLDDEPERKLHVEIKPITNGSNLPSATVDELKATIEGFNINTSMFNTVVRLKDLRYDSPIHSN